jgi:hypothetical protein
VGDSKKEWVTASRKEALSNEKAKTLSALHGLTYQRKPTASSSAMAQRY